MRVQDLATRSCASWLVPWALALALAPTRPGLGQESGPLEGPGQPAGQRRVASPQGNSATQVRGFYDDQGRYLGGGWIEVHYGRPIRRGRSPFALPDFVVRLNDGAPVWRAGANLSTRLVTELPLRIQDVEVEPGEYTVFIQLEPETWTFILSRWPAQRKYEQHNRDALFGAFHYRPERDVVRAAMTIEKLPYSFDQLSWQFLDMTNEGGRLVLLWDDRMASVWFAIEPAE